MAKLGINGAVYIYLQNLIFIRNMESSLINNTMLVQIALLAWVFLGEEVAGLKILGLGLVALGVLVVQLRLKLRFFGVKAGSVAENSDLSDKASGPLENKFAGGKNPDRLEGELD